VAVQRPTTVFFDFDNTLSEPISLFSQFVRHTGRLFSERFGGEAQTWEKATADMLVAVEDDYIARFVGNPTNGYRRWLEALRDHSMGLVFEAMDLPLPPDAERIARESQFEALSCCDAAFPGAATALTELTRQGHTLHMASGQESEYLRGGLTGMGLVHCFGRLFGPDLIDCAKEGPEYYTAMFTAVGVRSAEVIVVDDYPPAIGWAVAVGAPVIQARLSSFRHEAVQPGVAAVMTDLRELPRLVAQIVGDSQT
jgi:phosphoglycolate phosphatase-like HAD superfamily hydrolase